MSNNNNLSTINQLGWAVRPRKTVLVVHSFENDGSQQLPCSWTVLLPHKISCIVIPFCAQSRTLYPLCLGFQSVTIIYEALYRKIPGVLILKAHLLLTSQSQSFPTPYQPVDKVAVVAVFNTTPSPKCLLSYIWMYSN